MAVMTDTDRHRAAMQWMRERVRLATNLAGLTKIDLRSAVNDTDDWIEAAQGSFNTALPEPFKSTANVTDKTLLFCYVALRRAGLLRAEED